MSMKLVAAGLIAALPAFGRQGTADADVDWMRNRVDEARTRALKFLVDGHPAAVRFEKDGVLDPAYQFNSYPAKTGAAMIEARVLAAREFPDHARRHLDVARKLADVLIGMAPAAGRPLAHWVPTYRFHAECGERNPGLVCRRNEGLTMSRYPIDCAIAYLHLYQSTRERRYLDEAAGVAETYRRLQGDDGTWPLKLRVSDASAVPEWGRLIPGERIAFWTELYGETGRRGYLAVRDRSFAFLERGPMSDMDWKGQFEDGLKAFKPFENVCQHDVTGVVLELLERLGGDARRVAEARRLLTWAEGKFVLWEQPKAKDGKPEPKFAEWKFPGVVEQDDCYFPIDASAARFVRMYVAIYRREGRHEDLAKACRLARSICEMQRDNGSIQTFWSWPYKDVSGMEDWYDCILDDVVALGELRQVLCRENQEKEIKPESVKVSA